MTKPKSAGFIFVAFVAAASSLKADTVSFLIDPTTIDANSDGFITGNEFSPTGSGGTVFTMEPTDNLVGADRFFLTDTEGLRFGGGGGSTISFDLAPSNDILLNSYTITENFAILGNPLFDIREGATVLSMSNSAASGTGTNAFESGPIALDAGTTYTFQATSTGAGIQSFLGSIDYTVTAVPEPSTIGVLALCCGVFVFIKHRRIKNANVSANATAT